MKVKTKVMERAERYLRSKCSEVKFIYKHLGYDFTCGREKYVVYRVAGETIVVPYLKLKESLRHYPKVLLVTDNGVIETTTEKIMGIVYGEGSLMLASGLKIRSLKVTLKSPPGWVTLKVPVPKHVYVKFLKKMRLRRLMPDEMIEEVLRY